MEIGFIGLGKMGFPMARRLIEAKHQLVVFDTRKEAVDQLVRLGAQAASSPKDVADRTETVMASLPSLQASLDVATGKDGVIEGEKVKRFVDLSTVGSQMAVKIHDILAKTNIVQVDSPVSGGVTGAEKGTLAVMVSGPKADYEAIKQALEVIGKVFFIGTKPGSGQTMKLANNFLSATAMVATSEAVVMGVKSGLDPKVMIDVINAGSGMNTASRDKFPRAVLPRSFDFGFATGLMVKDVRLAVEEMRSLGLSMEVAEAVGRLWETVIKDQGADSDFTSAIKPIEKAAGVVVGGSRRRRDGEVTRSIREQSERNPGSSASSYAKHGVRFAQTTAAWQWIPLAGRYLASQRAFTATAPACPSRSAPRPRCAGAPRRTGRP